MRPDVTAPLVRRALLAAPVLLLGACGGPPPLALVPVPVPVAYDGVEVHDVLLVDVDHDGDRDLIASTAEGLRYLRCDKGRCTEETLGTALEKVAPVTRLALDGDDILAQRSDRVVRLVYSGIGSWKEAPENEVRSLPAPELSAEADFNADGIVDRAHIAGRSVRIELRDGAGTLHDVTSALGADGLPLRGEGTRLFAVDLDGDGDIDILAVGSRILALINNGGVFALPGKAKGASFAAAPPAAGAVVPAQQAPAAPSASDPSASPAWFTDVTAAAGLAFTHKEGDEQWDIRPTMGPGVAFADVDGDLDQDLYVVGGSTQLGRLYLNDGAGHFTDATAAWGLEQGPHARGAGMGASLADWDDDGDPDLYVTRDGPNAMWRNDGGHFTDVTDAAGTACGRWSASVAWADIDRDGDLDLYVTNYLKFDTAAIPLESNRAGQRREDPLAMLPYVFPAEPDLLFRNDGGGRFTDISESAGITAAQGKGLGVAFFDEDDDLWPDIYVANDTTPNFLWHNDGRWRAAEASADKTADGGPAAAHGGFEELALFVGLDDPRGGMGVALADVDGDGDEDIFTSYWQTEPNALYRNNAVHKPTTRRFVPRFEDVALAAGLAQPSVGVVGWGCVLADLDNDGDDDLFVANGYTSPDYETTMTCVGQLSHLYENVTAKGALVTQRDVPRWTLLPPERAGAYFASAWAGRGAAAADIDGDGDLDLAITSNNGPLVLLRNERGGRSLHVVPEGDGRLVNRDAVGARVTLTFDDGSTAVAFVRDGSSYLSGSERGVRFGCGARAPASLTVRWPDGGESTLAVPEDALTRPGGLRVAR